MIKIIKKIYPLYLLFTVLLFAFFAFQNGISGGNSSAYLHIFLNVTVLFCLTVSLMWLMGRPPEGKNVISSFENATIDMGIRINRRKLRRWVSCSYGIDDGNVVIYTFAKPKEIAKVSEILDIYKENSSIIFEFSGYIWYLTSEAADKDLEKIKDLTGR